jgi:hypothetical protein
LLQSYAVYIIEQSLFSISDAVYKTNLRSNSSSLALVDQSFDKVQLNDRVELRITVYFLLHIIEETDIFSS